MIPTEIVDMSELLAWGEPQPGSQPRPYGEQFVLRLAALDQVAASEELSRHEWIVRRTMVALWDERLRSSAVAVYALRDFGEPLAVVTVGSRSPAKFGRLVEIFDEAGVLYECGRGFVPPRSMPYVLWRPASRMMCLWPPYMDGISGRGSLAVDTQFGLDFPFDIDSREAARLRALGGRDGHLLLFPETDGGEFTIDGRVYAYVNRVIELPAGRK